MNAATRFPTADRAAAVPPPAGFQDPAAAWSGPRQRVVLEAFAEGCTVPDACRRVGLTPASLYAFANSAEGRRFSVGWDTAMLRSRRAIQDLALSRVVDGFEERTLRANGEVVVRHRYDNRLMMRMLERLDRHAESYGPQSLSGARMINEEFGEFLDSISDDPVANHAAIVESARPGELPGWAGRHAPTVFGMATDRAPHDAAPAAPADDVRRPCEPAAPPPADPPPTAPQVPAAPDDPLAQDEAGAEGEGGQAPGAEDSALPNPVTVHMVHDADRTLVDVIVSNPPEPLTRAQAEEQVYAQVRAGSAEALPPTLAALRASHGRTGHLPAASRKLWHRGGGADLVEIGILDLDGVPAGQGSV